MLLRNVFTNSVCIFGHQADISMVYLLHFVKMHCVFLPVNALCVNYGWILIHGLYHILSSCWKLYLTQCLFHFNRQFGQATSNSSTAAGSSGGSTSRYEFKISDVCCYAMFLQIACVSSVIKLIFQWFICCIL